MAGSLLRVDSLKRAFSRHENITVKSCRQKTNTLVGLRHQLQNLWAALWMGESGENTDEWIASFRSLLEQNKMGWCFWPYKNMDATSCVVSIKIDRLNGTLS